MLSKLTGKRDITLDMRLIGSVQSCQQPNILRSLSSRVAEGNGPKKPGNPPASSQGRVQTPAEHVFREMRGMENTACPSRLFAALSTSPERAISCSVAVLARRARTRRV